MSGPYAAPPAPALDGSIAPSTLPRLRRRRAGPSRNTVAAYARDLAELLPSRRRAPGCAERRLTEAQPGFLASFAAGASAGCRGARPALGRDPPRVRPLPRSNASCRMSPAGPRLDAEVPAGCPAPSSRETCDVARAAARQPGRCGTAPSRAALQRGPPGVGAGRAPPLEMNLDPNYVLVIGKGSRERVVPLGKPRPPPARRLPCVAADPRGHRPRPRSSSRTGPRSAHAKPSGSSWGVAGAPSASRRARLPAQPPPRGSRPISSTAAPISAPCRRCSVTPTSRPRRSTPTSHRDGCARCIGAFIHARYVARTSRYFNA